MFKYTWAKENGSWNIKKIAQDLREGADPSSYKLPDQLKKSAPRYAYGPHQFKLEFESDYDKAAYIVQGKMKSSAHEAFVKNLADALGASLWELSLHGSKVKDAIKNLAKEAISSGKEVIFVPKQF